MRRPRLAFQGLGGGVRAVIDVCAAGLRGL
jgi:hypothetical protein